MRLRELCLCGLACAAFSVAADPLAECVLFLQSDVDYTCENRAHQWRAERLVLLLEPNSLCCEDIAARESLEALSTDFQRSDHPGFGGDQIALDKILTALDLKETDDTPSLWIRFLNWLKQFVPEQNESLGWLRQWLDDLSIDSDTATGIFKALVVLLALSGVGIVLNELRHAGVFRRHRSQPDTPLAAARPLLSETHAVHLSEIESLSGAPQVIALFRAVVVQLRRQAAIADDNSLTNIELRRDLHGLDPESTAHFKQLQGLADGALYGGRTEFGREPPELADYWLPRLLKGDANE